MLQAYSKPHNRNSLGFKMFSLSAISLAVRKEMRRTILEFFIYFLTITNLSKLHCGLEKVVTALVTIYQAYLLQEIPLWSPADQMSAIIKRPGKSSVCRVHS